MTSSRRLFAWTCAHSASSVGRGLCYSGESRGCRKLQNRFVCIRFEFNGVNAERVWAIKIQNDFFFLTCFWISKNVDVMEEMTKISKF